ncbi:MAG: hypothetical protein ACTSPZ_07910 [Promethearchaeota archaeon]
MTKTKMLCPICGKKMNGQEINKDILGTMISACSYKCIRILERVYKAEEKTRIERKNLSPEEKARIKAVNIKIKKQEPWYLSTAGLTCIAWIIIGILALIFAPQLIFLVLHG